MDAGFEARLQADGVTFEGRDATLLRAVDSEGSLNAAATSLGRSYSRCHERLADLEDAFGPLVERTRGGSGGGGSRLNDRARALLARFERLRAEFSGVAGGPRQCWRGGWSIGTVNSPPSGRPSAYSGRAHPRVQRPSR